MQKFMLKDALDLFRRNVIPAEARIQETADRKLMIQRNEISFFSFRKNFRIFSSLVLAVCTDRRLDSCVRRNDVWGVAIVNFKNPI